MYIRVLERLWFAFLGKAPDTWKMVAPCSGTKNINRAAVED